MTNAKDTTPEGYIYFGKGPLKVQNLDCIEGLVAAYAGVKDIWKINRFSGNSHYNEYAIKAGSELARLNGLEETPKKVLTSNPKPATIPTMKYTIPDQSLAPKQFEGYVYVGNEAFDDIGMEGVGCFGGYFEYSEQIKTGFGPYGRSLHRYLPENSPLLEKYFMKTTPKTEKKPMKKITLTVVSLWKNDSGERIEKDSSVVAFKVASEGHEYEDAFKTKSGIEIRSSSCPQFHSECKVFYINGTAVDQNNNILLVTKEDFKAITKAVEEYNAKFAAPKVLYTATFFYDAKKGSKSRRLVDVYEENDEFIFGLDQDKKGVRKFLKTGIVGNIVKV